MAGRAAGGVRAAAVRARARPVAEGGAACAAGVLARGRKWASVLVRVWPLGKAAGADGTGAAGRACARARELGDGCSSGGSGGVCCGAGAWAARARARGRVRGRAGAGVHERHIGGAHAGAVGRLHGPCFQLGAFSVSLSRGCVRHSTTWRACREASTRCRPWGRSLGAAAVHETAAAATGHRGAIHGVAAAHALALDFISRSILRATLGSLVFHARARAAREAVHEGDPLHCDGQRRRLLLRGLRGAPRLRDSDQPEER